MLQELIVPFLTPPGTGLEENNRFFIGHWAQQCVYGVFSCTVVTEAYTCASLACNCWEYIKNVKDVIVKQESFFFFWNKTVIIK